jgi:hypothetical protein
MKEPSWLSIIRDSDVIASPVSSFSSLHDTIGLLDDAAI